MQWQVRDFFLFFSDFFRPSPVLFPLPLSYGIVHCKHKVATLLVALFWRRHRDSRPDWGKVHARIILGQRDRVRLARNHDWDQLLQFTLSPLPTGKGFYLHQAPTDLQAAKKTRKRKRQIYDESLQVVDDEEPSIEASQDDENDEAVNDSSSRVYFERPRPKRRKRDDEERTEATFQSLLKAAAAETDSTIKKWVTQHYPMYAKSITYTGKHHTLQVLAQLVL